MGAESDKNTEGRQNLLGGGSESASNDCAQRFARWFKGKDKYGNNVHRGLLFYSARFLIVLVLIYLVVALLSGVLVIAIPVLLWLLIRYIWRRLAATMPDSNLVVRLSSLSAKTRKIGCGVFCALLTLILVDTFCISNVFKEELDNATLVEDSSLLGTTSNNPYRIEYGSKESGKTKIAVSDLFKSSDAKVNLSSDSTLDTKSIGEQSAVVTLSNDAGSKDVTLKFLVRDTQKPEIKIKDETVTLTQGDEFDPAGNVTVTDPVDGALARVDSRPESVKDTSGAEGYASGWYMLSYTDPAGNATLSLDTTVTGAYKVSAIAYDKSGNCSGESHFTVIVKNAEVSEQSSAQAEEASSADAVVSQSNASQTSPATAPESHEYVINTSTKKIHDPGCSSAKKMKEQNKQTVTSTLADLEAQGYEPCGICHPR